MTAAALEAWEHSTIETPWRIPLKRLALSAAAAVLVTSLANHFSNFGTPATRSDLHSVNATEMRNLEALPEAAYSPLMNRLIQTHRRSTRPAAPALRRYMEDIQKILNELEGDGAGVRPTPNKGGSRLLPKRPGWGAHC